MRLENDSPDIKIDSLFKNHFQRHQIIKVHYDAFKSFTDTYLVTFIESGKEKFKNLVDLRELKQLLDQRKNFFKEFGESKINKWWDNANNKKNQGFYVDFRDNNWIKPTQIRKEDYLESYQLVSNLISTSFFIKNYIEAKNGSQQ